MFRKGRGGRGRGSSSNRPSLPFKLTKELDLGDGVTPKSKTRGSMFKGTHLAAIDAEAALQRQLAKKLGIKGKKRKAPEATLHEALDELDTLFAEDDDGPGQKENEDDPLMGLSDSMEGGPDDSEDSDEFPSASDDEGTEGGGMGLESDSDVAAAGDLSSELEESEDEEGSADSEDDSLHGSSDESSDAEADSNHEGGIADADQQRRVESQQAGTSGHATASVGKYVPPAARNQGRTSDAMGSSERLTKQVKGLLNRLAEANLQSSVEQAAELLQSESRRAVIQSLTDELLQAVAEGPRATDRFAAVTAAFMAGLAGTARAAEVAAHFLGALAARMEAAVQAEDSLAASNLAHVVGHMYGCRVLEAATLYSLLDHLRQRFSEQDVALIFALLNSVGYQLRSDDPAAMKDFVTAVHARAGKASGEGKLSSRAEVLLSLVLDIKNNKQRSKSSAVSVSSVLSAGVLKWLKSSGMEEVQLRTLSWAKVLQPKKKGLWWLPLASEAGAVGPLPGAAGALAEAAGDGGAELLRAAAAQRMNTETRRAVFCVVMGAQDCADASERLLRLPLKGEAEREVVRVVLECCLQERLWNPYYAHLLASVTRAVKGHRITLQFCLWDHFKQARLRLDEGDVRRLANLARLLSMLIASKAVPITVVKVVDFTEAMSARQLLFWRALFEELLGSCASAAAAEQLFAKFGGSGLATVRSGLTLFLRRQFGPWLAAKHTDSDDMLEKLQAAEAGLEQAALQ
ncbi:MIF4G-domain-containing protein [Coccomyxa subellipsoidea C-169]|uniref:MIF4G-domain-containing protein n=1 Tax=Coccomyxa subellipsoidea (strain C-169) TaxID=574566 RepID=I0YMP7_COCSC|nr:MIF4G-domain-containing protein [Coccomyxa subellipsoidea C-169]EIE19666.1 MIF4G-domain-containing protein [Coccomyxa subellipsoidea C-169]|eukprot:XP_005644210.1 MIF4G-domain-containing protein [Coccomyxa subellipsoidea C-169]